MPYLSPEELQAYAYQQHQQQLQADAAVEPPALRAFQPTNTAESGQRLANLASGVAVPGIGAGIGMASIMLPMHHLATAGKAAGRVAGAGLGGMLGGAGGAAFGAKALGVAGMLSGYGLMMAPISAAQSAVNHTSAQIIDGQREFLATREMLRELPHQGAFGPQSALSSGGTGGFGLATNPMNATALQSNLQSIGKRYGATTGQLRNLTSALAAGGNLDTRNVQTVSDSLRKSLQELSTIAERVDGDIEEAYEVYEGLKNMGFSTAQTRFGALKQMQGVSSLTGLSVGAVSGLGSNAMNLASDLGLSRNRAFRASMTNLATAGLATASRSVNQNYLRRVGGMEGLAARMTEIDLGMAQSQGFSSLMSEMFDTDGSRREGGARMGRRRLGRSSFFRGVDPYEMEGMTDQLHGEMPALVFERIRSLRSGARNATEANRRQFEFLQELGISDPTEQLEYLRNLQQRPVANALAAGQRSSDNINSMALPGQRERIGRVQEIKDVFGRLVDDILGDFNQQAQRFGQALQIRSETLSRQIGDALSSDEARTWTARPMSTRDMSILSGLRSQGVDLLARDPRDILEESLHRAGRDVFTGSSNFMGRPTTQFDAGAGPYGRTINRAIYGASVGWGRFTDALQSRGSRPPPEFDRYGSLGRAYAGIVGTDDDGFTVGSADDGSLIRMNSEQILQSVAYDLGAVYEDGQIHTATARNVRAASVAASNVLRDRFPQRRRLGFVDSYAGSVGVAAAEHTLTDAQRRRLIGEGSQSLLDSIAQASGYESFQAAPAQERAAIRASIQEVDSQLYRDMFPGSSDRSIDTPEELYSVLLEEAATDSVRGVLTNQDRSSRSADRRQWQVAMDDALHGSGPEGRGIRRALSREVTMGGGEAGADSLYRNTQRRVMTSLDVREQRQALRTIASASRGDSLHRSPMWVDRAPMVEAEREKLARLGRQLEGVEVFDDRGRRVDLSGGITQELVDGGLNVSPEDVAVLRDRGVAAGGSSLAGRDSDVAASNDRRLRRGATATGFLLDDSRIEQLREDGDILPLLETLGGAMRALEGGDHRPLAAEGPTGMRSSREEAQRMWASATREGSTSTPADLARLGGMLIGSGATSNALAQQIRDYADTNDVSLELNTARRNAALAAGPIQGSISFGGKDGFVSSERIDAAIRDERLHQANRAALAAGAAFAERDNAFFRNRIRDEAPNMTAMLAALGGDPTSIRALQAAVAEEGGAEAFITALRSDSDLQDRFRQAMGEGGDAADAILRLAGLEGGSDGLRVLRSSEQLRRELLGDDGKVIAGGRDLLVSRGMADPLLGTLGGGRGSLRRNDQDRDRLREMIQAASDEELGDPLIDQLVSDWERGEVGGNADLMKIVEQLMRPLSSDDISRDKRERRGDEQHQWLKDMHGAITLRGVPVVTMMRTGRGNGASSETGADG